VLVGLGHVDLVCRDLTRSLAFYRDVLGPLGLSDPVVFEGDRGEQIHYLRFPIAGSGSIGLRQALEDVPFELYGPGLHHVALAVDARSDVDLAYENARAAGAHLLHAPRVWPRYHPAYYACFFEDPDGFRVEIAASRDARL
jgi:catechol 2,3-dioxygenase-like lactoylglutathione lyase family enzyme